MNFLFPEEVASFLLYVFLFLTATFLIGNFKRKNYFLLDIYFLVGVIVALQFAALIVVSKASYLSMTLVTGFYFGMILGRFKVPEIRLTHIKLNFDKFFLKMSFGLLTAHFIIAALYTGGGFLLNAAYTQDLLMDMYRSLTGLKYLYFAARLIFVTYVLKLYFETGSKRYILFMVIVLFVHDVFTHLSKAGLLFLLYDFFIAAYFYRRNSLDFQKPIRQLFLCILAILPGLVFLSHYSESPHELLLLRIVDNARSIFIGMSEEGLGALLAADHSQRLAWYFDQLLSPLRLKSWESMSVVNYLQNLQGYNVVENYGANPTFIIDSLLVFGELGILYIFVIGFFLSILKRFKKNFVFYFIFAKSLIILLQDSGNFFSILIGFAIFFPAMIFVGCLLRFSRGRSEFRV